MFNRSSGILMHVSSLENPYGIGTFGKSAYEFVEFLKAAGQSYWQLLPLGPTGYGESPYQSPSTFAGNFLFIDLEILVGEKWLVAEDLEGLSQDKDKTSVDYKTVSQEKMVLLRKAFANNFKGHRRAIEAFFNQEKDWLEDYVLFMALKEAHGHQSWQTWPKALRQRDPATLKKARASYKEDIDFWTFVQYIFYKQWHELKVFANKNGVEIIGDIPIYVAEDSSDVWSHPELFLLDENNAPICVSGCPPDAFSEDGQLWGNPIYDWPLLEAQGYTWWIKRIKASYALFDVIRIDHFRGFESYWSIPGGAKNAVKGQWVEGPGMKLFDAIKAALGPLKIIAEDLGFLTQAVKDFKDASGYPGMKVLEFAFDSKEESDYLPHNYQENCFVYTGTHDNDTVMGWFEETCKEDVDKAIAYLNLNEEEGYAWGFIRGAWSSVGRVAIAQMQDFLELGSQARMNIPSTIGDNWKWRIRPGALTPALAKRLYTMTKLYGRLDQDD